MPELGKATYLLELNSAQFNEGMTQAEARADSATANIGRSLGLVQTDFEETGAVANTAADEVSVANDRMAASTEAAAAKTSAAATGMRAKFMAMGKIGKGGLGLAAVAAGYLFVKGGLDYVKSVQESMLQVNNAVKNTGKLTGVSVEGIKKISEAWVGVRGQTYAVNLQTASLLARYNNIRNLGPGMGMVYNRAFTAIQNIVAGTGKNARMITIALGKALQDPVKNYNVLSRAGIQINKDLITKIYQTKGPLAAQNYILAQINQKYGGAAQASLKSFTAQWTKFRESLDQIAATVLQKVIPLFAALTGAMNRHKSIVKAIIYALLALAAAFVAVKVAAIAFNTVMSLMKFAQWIAGFAGLAGAEEGATGAAVAGRTAMLGFGESMLWALGPIGLLVAGLLVLEYTIHKVQKAQAEANAAVLRPGMGSEKRSSEALFFGARERAYIKGGMGQVAASKKASADTRAKFNDATFGTAAGKSYGSDAAAKAAADKFGKSLSKGTFTGNATAKPGQLPTNLALATLAAERTGNKTTEIAAYRADAAYYQAQLASGTLSPADQVKVSKALTAIDKKIATAMKTSKAKGAFGGVLGALAGYNKLAFNVAQAATTKGLKDDRAALAAEEKFLRGVIDNRKNSLKVRTAAAKELKSVMDKLAKVNKDITTSVQTSAKEIQATMDLRGTFFGEFAGDIFGQSAAGLTAGVNTGNDVTVHQNNTFHEIPKDRHKIARQMRGAVQHAMAT